MPTAVTYPGVYIEEVPSGVHTITGVATSIAAFIGYTPRGQCSAQAKAGSAEQTQTRTSAGWTPRTTGSP